MLARFFIDRPVLAWVISIVIVLLGAIAAGFLPIAEYPEITPPTVRVTASYPGANVERRGRHGGRADRAAGRWRGRDDVHVVAEQQRRLVHPGRDLRAGHQREHGPGAGAEPRRHRRADAPRRGSDHRRGGQETVPGRLAGDQSVFRRQPGDRPAVL